MTDKKTALHQMHKRTGLQDAQQVEIVGNSINHLIGIWSAEDEAEFRSVTEDFEHIDEDSSSVDVSLVTS